MTLYEFNQQVMKQLNPLNFNEILKAKETIDAYKNKRNNNFYMLLCHEKRYYTIFSRAGWKDTAATFADAVMDCAFSLGQPLNVEENNDGAVEIWVKDEVGNTNMILLFPYDNGVIEWED